MKHCWLRLQRHVWQPWQRNYVDVLWGHRGYQTTYICENCKAMKVENQ